jgi:predicted  nucleic acid-binding Zn-ribbon protein
MRRVLESGPMHPAVPQLIELQRLDQITATLRADLEGLPRRLREADAKLNGARAAVTAAKEAHTQSLTHRKKLELDVDQWKERAKKYRAQSSSVKTNEAYKALQQEIANAEAEASKAEDIVLEQMMKVEEVERRVKRLEAELKEAEQAIAGGKKQIEERFSEEKQKWLRATAEREAIAKKVPEELLDLYMRLAKKHPGSVMAEARGEQCRGCGMRVLPHTLQLLKSEADEEVFRCEGCGRILYSLEPIPHAAPKESANGVANS